MSRAYRISVKESESRCLRADDEIGTKLEILDILTPEDMATLLKEELKSRGFQEQEDGTLTRQEGGITVVVDPCSGEVTVKSQTEETVSQEAKREATGYDDTGPKEKDVRAKTKKQLKEDLDKQFEKEQARIQAKTSEQLEKHLQKLQPEISEVVNKVTRDALKQKASQLGAVKEIHEDEKTGSLTIKLEV
jgi:type II secretory ATPase GspE/PulE/Tfp pilus assembly ATPase PilB-like protein